MQKLTLCALVGGLCLSLSACGNANFAEVSGRVGFSLNAAGGIIVNVETCGAELDLVDLAGPNINGENHRYVELKSREPLSGYFEVDIANPAGEWSEESPSEIPQKTDELLIANASFSRKDVQASQVDATLAEIRALTEGQILIGSADTEVAEASRKIVSREEFSHCDR